MATRAGGPRYTPRYSGGDVDDPAFLDFITRLQTWVDAPAAVRELVRQFRPLVEQDADAWKRRHNEAGKAGEAREQVEDMKRNLAEQVEDMKRNLAEQGFDVDVFSGDFAITPALLARHVAAMHPWERQTFDRLLAEETGDAWTRLPKVS